MGTPGTKPAKTDLQASEGCGHSKTSSATRLSLSATYSIDLEKRFVLVKFTGSVTFRDIEAYALDLRTNPRFSPILSEIVDLRYVERVELSPAQAINLANRVDPFAPASRRAFVAQSQDQINASHMHRILRPEGDTIRVFFPSKKRGDGLESESSFLANGDRTTCNGANQNRPIRSGGANQ